MLTKHFPNIVYLQTQVYPSNHKHYIWMRSTITLRWCLCSRHSLRSVLLFLLNVCILQLLFTGYLMAAHHGHGHPTTYECVDGSPEYVTGESGNIDGALFYFVKAVCSGTGHVAHCPPYVQNKMVLCAVCSK